MTFILIITEDAWVAWPCWPILDLPSGASWFHLLGRCLKAWRELFKGMKCHCTGWVTVWALPACCSHKYSLWGLSAGIVYLHLKGRVLICNPCLDPNKGRGQGKHCYWSLFSPGNFEKQKSWLCLHKKCTVLKLSHIVCLTFPAFVDALMSELEIKWGDSLRGEERGMRCPVMPQ